MCTTIAFWVWLAWLAALAAAADACGRSLTRPKRPLSVEQLRETAVVRRDARRMVAALLRHELVRAEEKACLERNFSAARVHVVAPTVAWPDSYLSNKTEACIVPFGADGVPKPRERVVLEVLTMLCFMGTLAVAARHGSPVKS